MTDSTTDLFKQIASDGARGFYTPRRCGLVNYDEIADFVSQDRSMCQLKPFGQPAKLATFSNAIQLADFRTADGYLHSLEKSYSQRWAFGFLIVPNKHTQDQYLLAAGPFEIYIPANSLDLVLRYAGRSEMSMPVECDTGVVLFCGYPGSSLRAWVNGGTPADIKTETAVWPAKRAVIGADRRGQQPWRGLLGDFVIYERYEPAINKNLPEEWKAYLHAIYA